MKKLILVVMAGYALTARAQLHDSKNFVYLYSDSVIQAKKIQMRPDLSGYWQLRVDSRRLPLVPVKFFKNEDGFFANTRKLNLGTNLIAELVVEGRINLFQLINYSPVSFDRFYRYGKNRNSAFGPGTYYNIGFGDLKHANYRNLKNDLSDHAKSMDLLKSYRKRMKTGVLLYTAAGLLAATGSFLILSDMNSSKSMSTGFGRFNSATSLIGLGLGFTAGAYLVQESASHYLEDAVDAYNR